MFRIHTEAKLLNRFIKTKSKQDFTYSQGRLNGNVSVPVGTVSVVVIPSCTGSSVVFSIPFSEINKGKSGGFFLSKLIGTAWGAFSKQIEDAVVPVLQKKGLPRDILTIEKTKDSSGDVGKVRVSLDVLNRWLAGKHPRLTPSVKEVLFFEEGVEVVGQVEAT